MLQIYNIYFNYLVSGLVLIVYSTLSGLFDIFIFNPPTSSVAIIIFPFQANNSKTLKHF